VAVNCSSSGPTRPFEETSRWGQLRMSRSASSTTSTHQAFTDSDDRKSPGDRLNPWPDSSKSFQEALELAAVVCWAVKHRGMAVLLEDDQFGIVNSLV
jgi:hypothetical protein